MTDLKTKLKEFIGNDCFYKHPLFPKYLYTEGVRYLAKEGNAYWLIEYVFSRQDKNISKHPFQVWKLQVHKDRTASIIIEDGNCEKITSYQLDYTDFPIKEITLWFIEGTLLLPSEY